MKNFAVIQHLMNTTAEAAEIIRDLRNTMAYLEIIRL